MPPRQKVFVPATEGVRQDRDARVAPVGHWETLDNVQVDATGAFVKRPGFARISDDYEGQNDVVLDGIRFMFSTGREMLAIDATDLWAYDDANDEWRWRGTVAPGVLDVRTIARDLGSVFNVAASRGGDEICYQWRRYYQTGDPTAGTTETKGLAAIQDIDGHQLSRQRWPGGNSPQGFHAHCVGSAAGNMVLWSGVKGSPATNRDIKFEFRPLTVPSTNWQLTGTSLITSDYFPVGPDFGQADQWRGFDVSPVYSDSTQFLLGYLQGSSVRARLQRWDMGSSQTQNGSTLDIAATDYSRTSWYRIAVHDDPTLDRFWVVLASEGGEGVGDELLIFGCVRSTMAVSWGPTVIDTSGGGTTGFTNIGVARGTLPGGEAVIAVTWTEATLTSGDAPIAKCATLDIAGGNLSTVLERCNLYTTTFPFFVGNHVFSGCRTRITYGDVPFGEDGAVGSGITFKADVFSNIFESDVVMRWQTDSYSTTGIADAIPEQWIPTGVYLAGVYNVSFACGGQLIDTGCAQRVYESSGVFTWANMSQSRSLKGDAYPQFMAELVTLDTNEVPLGTAVGEEGAAVIGGSVVTWYDGVSTFELGHVCQPLVVDIAETQVTSATPGLTASDTHYYTATWVYPDATGTLHRSAPSYVAYDQFTASGSNDSFELTARLNPATSRNAPQAGLVWFKAINDVQTRFLPSSFFLPNQVDRQFDSDAFYDYDQVTAENALETLYTAGGELEAIAPEGARIPIVSNGRLWLGDMARRERVQYSKVFAPGTAGEFAVAPEFNEGFGYVLASGERVTGMASLDDKTIILTDRGIYTNVGDGPVDDGSQNNFSGPRSINTDGGCIDPRSVAVYPDGVIFQSQAGFYLVDRGLSVSFVGSPVQDYLEDYPEVTSAVVVPEDSHIRFTCVNSGQTAGIILVFDYEAKVWFRWTPEWWTRNDPTDTAVPIAACYHQPNPAVRGTYYVADKAGGFFRLTTDTWSDGTGNTDYDYPMKCVTGWIQAASHGGWQRVQNVVAMCEDLDFYGANLFARTDFDAGEQVGHTYLASSITFPRAPDAPLFMKLQQQKNYALQLEYEDLGGTQGMKLSGFYLEIIPKAGPAKVSADQRA